MVKDQETRSIFPVASPRGIPIIKPNPITNEGAIAISGLSASERRTIRRVNPKKRRGFMIRPIINEGMGNMISPVAGLIAVKFIVRRTIEVEIVEITNPGRKIFRLLPRRISPAVSGVASREVMTPLTFSLTRGRLAKDQINEINTKTGRK